MIGLVAGEARAASLTLTVMAGATTVYTVTGSATAVTADTATLNSNLSLDGLGGYTFSSLGGSSNNPGPGTQEGSAFVLTSGNLNAARGGQGVGTVLTIILSEDGFTTPTEGPTNTLKAFTGGNYGSTAAGNILSDVASLTDATSTTISTGSADASFTGANVTPTGNAFKDMASFVSPVTLTNTLNISAIAAASSHTGSNGFSGQTGITTTAIPEPASIVMMLTGMPLPLVVLGLLRRRAAAGAQ
jgi:hypothetical protein